MTCLSRKPFAKFRSCQLGHIYRRITVLAHSEAHIYIRNRGAGDGIDGNIDFGSFLFRIHIINLSLDKQLVYLPWYFVFAHPKRRYFYTMCRTFILLSIFFYGTAPHYKFSRRNKNHWDFLIGACNFFGIFLIRLLGMEGEIQKKKNTQYPLIVHKFG